MNPTPEQLKDPAWWDANAPEGAEWFCNETDDEAAAWYKETQDGFMFMIDGDDRWFKSDSPDNDAIPRPTHPSWTGSGLPPVGVVCETYAGNRRVECEIVAHLETSLGTDCVFAYQTEQGPQWFWSPDPADFRPIKTRKERVVEKAHGVSGAPHEQIERLYDAGMLVDPDDSQN